MKQIEGYSFGTIKVDGTVYHKDLIIFPDKVMINWYRREGHSAAPEDLKEAIDYSPEVLVVGKGAYGGMKIHSATREVLAENKIVLVEENTERACETFNKYIEKGKKAVGAFHLSC